MTEKKEKFKRVEFGAILCNSFFVENEAGELIFTKAEEIKQANIEWVEFPFNKDPFMPESRAKKIGEILKDLGLKVSCHASYFINYGSHEEERIKKSHNYILINIKNMKAMGANKLIVHVGSAGKLGKTVSMENAKNALKELSKLLDAKKYTDVELCLEVMGKQSRIGNLEEMVELSHIDSRYNVCVDFGHLNCLSQGGLKTARDYAKVLTYLKENLPREKFERQHFHFTNIEYDKKGEVRHLNLEDTKFGPFFPPLAEALHKEQELVSVTIISEAKSTSISDASTLKRLFTKR
ncbi:MAG: TIM barrel protein [Firmicutes bacterium]|nr:TIM barrel protein [Bacillota bacterium]MCL2771483.1 TIM barrel protein [Bacillota bacterium]